MGSKEDNPSDFRFNTDHMYTDHDRLYWSVDNIKKIDS